MNFCTDDRESTNDERWFCQHATSQYSGAGEGRTDLVDPDLGDGPLTALGLEVRLDITAIVTLVEPANIVTRVG